MQVFGKDSILHLGGVETADSREAWAADTNMEVHPFLLNFTTVFKPAACPVRRRWTCIHHLSVSHACSHTSLCCSGFKQLVAWELQAYAAVLRSYTSTGSRDSKRWLLKYYLLTACLAYLVDTPRAGDAGGGGVPGRGGAGAAADLGSAACKPNTVCGTPISRAPGQETPAAEEFRDAAVAEHDDIRGVRMGAGERSYLVRDRRIDVLRNVHGGVQARHPGPPARPGGQTALAGRPRSGTCVGANPAYLSSFHAVQSYLAGCGDAERCCNLEYSE